MAAPRGNKNAQKWTIEKTDEVLSRIESLSLKPAIHFLTQAEEQAGVYPAIWTYWQAKWSEDPDIMHRMKIVELRFHNKLLMASFEGRIKAGLAKVLLTNNYGYAEPKPDKTGYLRHALHVIPPHVPEVYMAEDIVDSPVVAPPQSQQADTAIGPGQSTAPAAEEETIEDPFAPPAITVTPSFNAGRFHLECAEIAGGVYVFADGLREEVLRIPQISGRQYVDMSDPDPGSYTVSLIGSPSQLLGYFNVESHPYHNRIPPVIPD